MSSDAKESALAPDCADMIVIRPERQGGVILACTLAQGHIGAHLHVGRAEEYPLVENVADLGIRVTWST